MSLAAEIEPVAAAPVRACRVCGCIETNACLCLEVGPCWWVEDTLCSHCAEPAIVVRLFADMQARLQGGQTFARFELELWSRRAYSALLKASTSPMALFDP